MRDRMGLQVAVAVACAALGFVLVAQVRATEEQADRLVFEREEDLARILSDLSAQSERLQEEITDLRLTLFTLESSAESEEVARRNLERRLDDLAVLAGTTPVEGEGMVLDVEDPEGVISQDMFVDVVQELRDAGAEAIAINGERLLASSAFTTRGGSLALDERPLTPPYRFAAIGVGDTLVGGLSIAGGALDSLNARSGVTTSVEVRAELTLPEAREAPTYTFARPAGDESEVAR